MSFEMKYDIKRDYLKKGSKKRPGNNVSIGFIVAHDTGNPGSTARGNVNYYKDVQYDSYASAHLFVDDKEIIECVPLLTGKAERAYHVIYDVTTDNRMYGDDANDIAGGVELCWGGKINNKEAYKRYVWVLAYICYKYNLNPAKAIVGHKILDPGRKVDPHNGLSKTGGSYYKLLKDVVAEYNACTSAKVAKIDYKVTSDTYKVESGDTFWGIANEKGMDVQELMSLNKGIDPKGLQPGTTLNLKKEKVTVKTAPVTKQPAPIRPYPGILKRGSRGRDVEAVQRAVGSSERAVDGIFGKNTEAAVRSYQSRHGLTADGIVGPATWNKMF